MSQENSLPYSIVTKKEISYEKKLKLCPIQKKFNGLKMADQSINLAVEALEQLDDLCQRIETASHPADILDISSDGHVVEAKRAYQHLVKEIDIERINPNFRELAKRALHTIEQGYGWYFVRECRRIDRAHGPYEVLNIPDTTDNSRVKTVYRTLAYVLHPDVAPVHLKEEAGRAMSKVNGAYAVLNGPSRQCYR